MSAEDGRIKIGLALGSGVARGYAHIGAIRALEKHGIEIDIVAGTSIGALVGGSYVAGKLDVLETWAMSLNAKRLRRYVDISFGGSGLLNGDKIFKLLESHLSGLQIENLPKPFIALATDLGSGHEVWLQKGCLTNALEASFALPGVFPPVKRHRHFLIDGALVNPVPVSACRALGAHLTIAVDLNSDMIGKSSRPGQNFQTIMGFDPNFDDSQPTGFFGRLNPLAWLFNRNRNEPSFFGIMVSSLNIIQDRLTRSRLAGDPPDIHIKPAIGHIGMLEYSCKEELMQAGFDAVEESIDEIKAAIKILSY